MPQEVSLHSNINELHKSNKSFGGQHGTYRGIQKMVLHQSVPTSSVVWVKYKKGAVARVFVEVYPKERVRQHPTADHDGSALCAKMGGQLASVGWYI